MSIFGRIFIYGTLFVAATSPVHGESTSSQNAPDVSTTQTLTSFEVRINGQGLFPQRLPQLQGMYSNQSRTTQTARIRIAVETRPDVGQIAGTIYPKRYKIEKGFIGIKTDFVAFKLFAKNRAKSYTGNGEKELVLNNGGGDMESSWFIDVDNTEPYFAFSLNRASYSSPDFPILLREDYMNWAWVPLRYQTHGTRVETSVELIFSSGFEGVISDWICLFNH